MIKTGLGIGALGVAAAAARYAVLSPSTTPTGASIDELGARIYGGLSSAARAQGCFDYHHPLRQMHNRGLWLGGLAVNAATMSWDARRSLATLLREQLSAAGYERLLSQFPNVFSGVNFLQLRVFGTPGGGPWQILLSGIHLNLRVGRAESAGTAFGGPQVYGDQRGNERLGLPGNVFGYQLHTAHDLISGLTPAQRRAIRVAQAPPQTCIAAQGRGGRFDGLPIADLPVRARRLATTVVAGIMENYGEAGAADAWNCLRANGGVDGLYFADYDVDFQGGRHAGDKPSQIFRLEGPGAVFHFRGEPHVHAFTLVERNIDQPLSLGEVLGVNPGVLAGDALRAWFESAMRGSSHADFAFYPSYSMAGRLRPGTLRTGDVWAAENWGDDLIVCEIRGAEIAPPLHNAMSSRGFKPQARATYRLATTSIVAADNAAARIGRVSESRNLGPLRDALVTQAKIRGFGA